MSTRHADIVMSYGLRGIMAAARGDQLAMEDLTDQVCFDPATAAAAFSFACAVAADGWNTMQDHGMQPWIPDVEQCLAMLLDRIAAGSHDG